MNAPRQLPVPGRLGVLLPGMGAVASTFVAGVLAARKGLTPPIGSLSQLARLDVGTADAPDERPIREVLPLTGLDDLVFGGWDPITTNLLEAARTAKVLDHEHLAPLAADLEAIVPMPAVFDRRWVSRLDGTRVKPQTSKRALVDALVEDILAFKAQHRCDRLVMVWCGSTEAFSEPSAVHASAAAFAQGLLDDDPGIAPSQMYAWAALQCGVPFANGAPNLTVDLPCMVEEAERRGVPLAGKDFKTGQTWMKTLVAPGLKARMLGLRGWYSTNILGNRDGEVLDAPENFKSKEVSKLGVLDTILEPGTYPELYGEIDHVVRINYYPPRGDNKEGWDNLDIFGWLGYPMQIKIDFLCRDSILAAPIVLDLALFLDLAHRQGASGVQEWLSFFLKAPQAAGATPAPHDLFVQRARLDATLRAWAGAAVAAPAATGA